MKNKIGIIGYGNMGSAIGQRIKSAHEIIVFDKDTDKTKKRLGIKITYKIRDLLDDAEAVILAVKPQDFDLMLDSIKTVKSDQLVISVAAGISTVYLESRLKEARVIRAMPNLAVRIGRGMSCICRGSFARDDDLNFAEGLFKILGEVLIIDEKLMDSATAVSGSGPGFLFSLVRDKNAKERADFTLEVFIPRLTEAAQLLGFNKAQAQVLAEATASGSLAMIETNGLSVEELCAQVTSKGGTTAAGLDKLQGSIENLPKAVEAARVRAGELAKKE